MAGRRPWANWGQYRTLPSARVYPATVFFHGLCPLGPGSQWEPRSPQNGASRADRAVLPRGDSCLSVGSEHQGWHAPLPSGPRLVLLPPGLEPLQASLLILRTSGPSRIPPRLFIYGLCSTQGLKHAHLTSQDTDSADPR